VAGEVVLALALGFIRLGHNSLWEDEIFSVNAASGSWGHLLHVLHYGDANMSLYDVVLHLWEPLGTSDAFLRVPSVVAFSATVPVVYLIGRRLISTRGGLLAGLLMALAPFGVQHAQEVRSYTLVTFLVSLSVCCFVVGVQDRNGWAWCGFSVFAALAIYAHFYAALVPIALAVALLVERSRVPWAQAVRAYLALCILAIPVLVLVLRGPRGQLFWLTRPGLHAALGQPSHLAGGSFTSVVFGVVILASLPFAIRQMRGPEPSGNVVILLSWLFLPYVITFAYSFLLTPIYKDRYLIVSLPALALYAAWAVMQFSHRWRTIAAAALIAASVVGVVTWYRTPPFQDWKAAVAVVEAHATPRDGIAFCWGHSGADALFARYRTSPPLRTVRAGTTEVPERVWVVNINELSHEPRLGCGLDHRLNGYDLASETALSGIRVRLYRTP
jgi:mannosyltransferase